MKIPPKLSELLQGNDLLDAETRRALSLARPWFEDNKVVFFPEYTDHGPRHVQEVFDTAESLISKEAWRHLNPEDAAALVLSILLHDCAMHLSKDGLVTLLKGGGPPPNQAFRDKPWPRLWEEFTAEARRFDQRKLKALFGRAEPAEPPPLDPLRMDEKDCLLVGEFLRRHHARLAHEIALAGVPGPPGRRLDLGTSSEPLNDLAGVIARSHNLDLRVCVDYFNAKARSGARRTSKVHVTYLMALLRIADYLQIHKERAPQQVLDVRALRSPVSRGEWAAHHAVTDIHQESDDPEAIWVEAAPPDVETYLKLKRLLEDIQRELDESWAVLGEVYAPAMPGLGLTVRRIKSTLDDTAAFARTVSYIPRRAALETAGAELLKLLITPLYGNRPGIGVRELLQNAVDACREMKDYAGRHPGPPGGDAPAGPDVSIHVDLARKGGARLLMVRDKGIGMTADTVLNYFLKAGASFRNSEAWWKQHADGRGQPRVLRSGRFGIGVLAGFLLGEVIMVTTRHVTAAPDEGISFACRLDDDVIQLNRESCPVGTTILILLSREAARYFERGFEEEEHESWDWYCLAEPSVQRVVAVAYGEAAGVPPRTRVPPRSVSDGYDDEVDDEDVDDEEAGEEVDDEEADEEEAGAEREDADAAPAPEGEPPRKYFELPQSNTLPSPGAPPPPKWRRFKPTGFLECHWTYDYRAPELVCNGIYIGPAGGGDTRVKGEAKALDRWVRHPKLSVFDPHGKLPLDLQRTRLNGPLPFRQELLESVHRDLIAYLLANTPDRPPDSRRGEQVRALRYPGSRINTWYWYAPQGVSLFSQWHVQQLAPRKLFIVPTGFEPAVVKFPGGVASSPVVPFHADPTDEVTVRRMVNGVSGPVMKGRRVVARIFKVRSRAEGALDKYHVEKDVAGWVLLRDGHCPPLDFKFESLTQTLDKLNLPSLGIYYPFPEADAGRASPLDQLWRDVVGLPYIPYDPRQRGGSLARAYAELGEYVKAWESVKGRGTSGDDDDDERGDGWG